MAAELSGRSTEKNAQSLGAQSLSDPPSRWADCSEAHGFPCSVRTHQRRDLRSVVLSRCYYGADIMCFEASPGRAAVGGAPRSPSVRQEFVTELGSALANRQAGHTVAIWGQPLALALVACAWLAVRRMRRRRLSQNFWCQCLWYRVRDRFAMIVRCAPREADEGCKEFDRERSPE